jgi:hypothetical protein
VIHKILFGCDAKRLQLNKFSGLPQEREIRNEREINSEEGEQWTDKRIELEKKGRIYETMERRKERGQ